MPTLSGRLIVRSGWIAAAALLLLAVVTRQTGVFVTLSATAAGIAVWARLKTVRDLRGAPSDREAWQKDRLALIVNGWSELMARSGCTMLGSSGIREYPQFVSYEWQDDVLVMGLQLPFGMTRAKLTALAPNIAESFGARAGRITDGPTGVTLRLTFADKLERVVVLPIPETTNLRAVPLGIRDDGTLWTVRLGPHTLVAGSSGSGKASLVWGLILGLAPAIKTGLVEIHGIDLKSAMELGMGRELLTRFAHTPESAVQLLEEAVASMQERATALSGKTRQHAATVESPHVVVLIDEMAALTAYQSDRDLMRRANAALALLCSQGRAVGYTVFACLQDPRKETLPMRGLFTQTIGLRLRDALETSMVLGEGMRELGAQCHLIPSTLPGVAYMVPEDGSAPIRVRAGNVTDEMIRSTADRFAAPRQRPLMPAPATDNSDETPRPRRSRRSTQKEGTA